jgi:hypothetical protein
MQEIKAFGIIKEAFKTYFKNFSYILKMSYPHIIIMYGAGFYFIREFDFIMQDPESIKNFTTVKSITLVLLLLLTLLAYINYCIHMVQLGMNKKIQPIGFSGLGLSRIHLRLLTISVIAAALFFGLYLLYSSFNITENSNMTAILILISIPVFIFMFIRIYLIFPALVHTNSLGYKESWNKTKGYGLTIFAIIIIFMLFNSAVSLLINPLEIINAFKNPESYTAEQSNIRTLLSMTHNILGHGIVALAQAILYRKTITK